MAFSLVARLFRALCKKATPGDCIVNQPSTASYAGLTRVSIATLILRSGLLAASRRMTACSHGSRRAQERAPHHEAIHQRVKKFGAEAARPTLPGGRGGCGAGRGCC